jgi:hypothetical protein
VAWAEDFYVRPHHRSAELLDPSQVELPKNPLGTVGAESTRFYVTIAQPSLTNTESTCYSTSVELGPVGRSVRARDAQLHHYRIGSSPRSD